MSNGGLSNEGLVRAIGRWSLAALVVNCVVGSGIFGLPSVLAALLGRFSVPAVILAAAAMGVIMACFAEVSSRFSQTGGPYLYAREAFGRFMGIQVGWLVWFVRLTACAANANLFVTYVGEFWPGATQPLPKLAILTALVGILAAVNFRGVRAGAGISNAFTAAKLGALGLVCAAGAVYLIAEHRIVPPSALSPGPDSWVRAMVLLIFAYGGFEAAVASAGEAKDPRRDMPFALFAALITCAVIYALIQWVVVGVLPDPGHSERPLADVARIVLGHSGRGLDRAGRAVFDLRIFERQHAGDAAHYLRTGRARRLPGCVRAGARALSHPVFFHLRIRVAGLAVRPVWQLRRQCHAFSGIAALLLRSGLRRASGAARASQKEKTRAVFQLPGRNRAGGFGSSALRGTTDANRIPQVPDPGRGRRGCGGELAGGEKTRRSSQMTFSAK